ncbi:MAG: helix-turn-helix transcriptional regulator [Clostridia bacterium]|nr:helix-turn-helix transcriptional regulator [Clostridia bacterium]
MTNNKAVEKMIKDRGYTKQYVAEQLGVSRQAFSSKLHGKTRWSAQDISGIKDLFGLSPEETFDIFLPRR